MVAAGLRHELVGHPRAAGGGLGVPGQEHREHVELRVVAGELVQRTPHDLGAKVRFGRLHVALHRGVQPLGSGQVNVEVDRSHGGADDSCMQATLLVLAGGESRRMGRPKAWLEVGETTLLRWMIERLGPAFSEVVVSFAEPEQVEMLVPFRLVFDRKRMAGPRAGIEAGLTGARHEVMFAVACDMPYVTPDVAEMAVAAARGCDAAMPRVEGRAEPVCAAYRRSALPAVTAALDAGRLAAADLAAQLDVTWLEGLDPELFRSLNTPEDFERFHDAFPAQR